MDIKSTEEMIIIQEEIIDIHEENIKEYFETKETKSEIEMIELNKLKIKEHIESIIELNESILTENKEEIKVKKENFETENEIVNGYDIKDNEEKEIIKTKRKKDIIIKENLDAAVNVAKKNSKTCHVCLKTFQSLNGLNAHSRIHLDSKPFQCQLCIFSFRTKDMLETHHLVTHHTDEKSYKCNVCNKCFKQFDVLQNHSLIHLGMKPHACDICDRKFRLKYALNIHKRVMHTRDKPFNCEICKTGFSSNKDLLAHHRMHYQKKRYSCDICNKYFRSDMGVRNHIKFVHCQKTCAERACHFCGEKFTCDESFYNHILDHGKLTQERCLQMYFFPDCYLPNISKLYKCIFCLRTSEFKFRVLKHLQKRHPNQRPYTCNMCCNTFMDEMTMKKHGLLKHGIKNPTSKT